MDGGDPAGPDALCDASFQPRTSSEYKSKKRRCDKDCRADTGKVKQTCYGNPIDCVKLRVYAAFPEASRLRGTVDIDINGPFSVLSGLLNMALRPGTVNRKPFPFLRSAFPGGQARE